MLDVAGQLLVEYGLVFLGELYAQYIGLLRQHVVLQAEVLHIVEEELVERHSGVIYVIAQLVAITDLYVLAVEPVEVFVPGYVLAVYGHDHGLWVIFGPGSRPVVFRQRCGACTGAGAGVGRGRGG